MARFLCIDYGKRRMGVAISDEGGKIALPMTTVEGNDEIFLRELRSIIEERGIEKIVIGLPLNLSGDESPMSTEVRAFAEKFASLEIEIILWDERLTSAQARRAMHEMGKKPSRSKSAVDRIAATLILQSYLDSISTVEDE